MQTAAPTHPVSGVEGFFFTRPVCVKKKGRTVFVADCSQLPSPLLSSNKKLTAFMTTAVRGDA
jgi:hypothetical protein